LAQLGFHLVHVRERFIAGDSFNAAHALRGYRGPAKDLHGHTINVEVSVEGSKLDHVGILYDARKLKTDVRSVLGRYANTYLNEVEPFDKINSTPENIARVVYEAVDAILPEHVRTTEVSESILVYGEGERFAPYGSAASFPSAVAPTALAQRT
jgi:6-pyruvoyltetrahydropterin/6-carboxytetrahydropterin synthase